MPDMTTPTTELEAVNDMLFIIGESPVNSLTNNESVDAATAQRILAAESKAVQSRGWHFNTDIERVLVRNTSNEIILPNNCVRVDTVGSDADIDAVQRGLRLYDRRKHTYTFERDLKCNLVVLLPFDELPEPARLHIFTRAGRRFAGHQIGSDTLVGFTEMDEQRSLAELESFEADTADHNILTGNYSVFRVIDRAPRQAR